MSSESADSDEYDEEDQVDEEDDSDTEAPPPMKKMGPNAGDGADGNEGKGFMAVRPYLGAIVPPSGDAHINTTAPDEGLELEYVYGYRSFDSKNNIVLNTRGHVVYPVAGLVVVLNRVKGTQTHFRGHTDDVRCLAQNPVDKDWVVSGQNGTIERGRATAPHVCVWNTTDFTECHILPMPSNARAIRAVGFSPDGRYVAVVANDDNHTLSIWDWRAKRQIISVNADKNPIFALKWNHVLSAPGIFELVTVGRKHAFFHTFSSSSSTLKSKRVSLGGAFPTQTWNTVTFSELGHTCLGGFDGTILICKQGSNGRASKAIPVVAEGQKAPKVFTLDTYQGGIVAGLSNQTVVVFDSKLQIDKVYEMKSKVTTVLARGQDLFIGTRDADIFEVKAGLASAALGGTVDSVPLVSGHFDGELWALDTFTSKDGDMRAVTAGEDNTIMVWDLAGHRVVRRGTISSKAGKAPRVKKASTTSLHPQNQCARAVAVSPDQAHIVVGTNDGHVHVLDATTLATIQSINLNNRGQRQVIGQEGNWIQTMVYSPSGHLLAVGTHGSVIVLLDPSREYGVRGVINSHHAAITHMDYTEDGETLRSNDLAAELLYHSLDDPDKPRLNGSASSLADAKWATQHCPFSYGALGVIQGDSGSVNSTALSPAGSLIASGDDDGKVNIFRAPCPAKGARFVSYNGHSSHVTSVRFTPDGAYLLSTGGHDLGLFQWKVGTYKPDTSGQEHQIK